LTCTNCRIITLAKCEPVKEEDNEEKRRAYLEENQEETLEEVEERANEGEMLLLEKVSSGFQAAKDA